MFKKILSIGLTAAVFVSASGASALAQTADPAVSQTVAVREKETAGSDIKSLVNAQTSPAGLEVSDKSTLAEYQKAQKQGKKFSTTTKVLIGVGITAAVIGIVVFAASRDKIRTF